MIYTDVLNTITNCEMHCKQTHSQLMSSSDCCLRANQLRLLDNCAYICGLTADYIAKNSPFSKQSAALCAQVCTTCGQECLQFSDEISQMCGQVCLNCASVCNQFASM